MKQLSDVGILYDSIDASHVPYREIKLNESRESSLTLFPLLSSIDPYNFEIKTVCAAERTERSLVRQAIPNNGVIEIANIMANIINPIDIDLIDVNFELHETLESVSNTAFFTELPITAIEKVSIQPLHVMSATSENIVVSDLPQTLTTDSEVILTRTIHQETSDLTIQSNNISNSEMAILMQRLSQSEHQDKQNYKHSFFERLQNS